MRKCGKYIFKNLSILMIIDVLALTLTTLMSLYLRFDFANIPEKYFLNFLRFNVIDCIIMLILFSIFKLYKRLWDSASIIELINIFISCSLCIIFEFVYKMLLSVQLPKSYYIIKLYLFMFAVIIIRYFSRITKTVLCFNKKKKDNKKTMIIGAGAAGRLLITEIMNSQDQIEQDVVCIIDDDKAKVGKYILGIPIEGTTSEIEKYCEKYGIEQIIIAIPSANKKIINHIIDKCSKTQCQVKILPKVYKMLDNVDVSNLREITYEDFLGRDEIVVDDEEISRLINDSTVLVTGGGGSIGSELCRQIAKCGPRKLIIRSVRKLKISSFKIINTTN